MLWLLAVISFSGHPNCKHNCLSTYKWIQNRLPAFTIPFVVTSWAFLLFSTGNGVVTRSHFFHKSCQSVATLVDFSDYNYFLHQIQICQPTDPWTADHGDEREVSNGARADCQTNSRWVLQLFQNNCRANKLKCLLFDIPKRCGGRGGESGSCSVEGGEGGRWF